MSSKLTDAFCTKPITVLTSHRHPGGLNHKLGHKLIAKEQLLGFFKMTCSVASNIMDPRRCQLKTDHGPAPAHDRRQGSPYRFVLFQLDPPWLRGIDSLPVDAQPLPNGKQPFLEDGNNQSVFSRPNVEKIVSSQTYCLNQFLERAETRKS